MPRSVWISDEPSPDRSLPAGPAWELVGEIRAFQERALWREVQRELGMISVAAARSVTFNLLGDPESGWVRDAARGTCRPVWFALAPLADVTTLLFARTRVSYSPGPSMSRHRYAAADLDHLVPLVLVATPQGYFDVVRESLSAPSSAPADAAAAAAAAPRTG